MSYGRSPCTKGGPRFVNGSGQQRIQPKAQNRRQAVFVSDQRSKENNSGNGT